VIPGSRVVFSKRFLKSVGLKRRLELHDRAGMLVSVDHDGFAEVLFDGDLERIVVLAENLVADETQARRISCRAAAAPMCRWAV
jgi:hypothetical protein